MPNCEKTFKIVLFDSLQFFVSLEEPLYQRRFYIFFAGIRHSKATESGSGAKFFLNCRIRFRVCLISMVTCNPVLIFGYLETVFMLLKYVSFMLRF
jgi:hypothetical protein